MPHFCKVAKIKNYTFRNIFRKILCTKYLFCVKIKRGKAFFGGFLLMVDIAKNELYISKLYHVIKSQTTKKFTYVSGRLNDGFILILSGKCNYIFEEGFSFTVEAGDLMYLAKDSFYKKVVLEEPFEHIHVNFDFTCDEDEDEDEKRKSAKVSLKSSAETEASFRRLSKSLSSSSPRARADSFSHLFSIYGDFIAASFPSYLPPGAKNAVSRAKARIYEELSNQALSVSSLSDAAGISEVHFRKLFKASEGVSPAKFIVFARLERAKILLGDEMLSLCDISRECGFSSIQYFCKVFGERIGMTPTEYRKNLKKRQKSSLYY